MKEVTIRLSAEDIEAVLWSLRKIAESEPSDNARYYERIYTLIYKQANQ
jgi:hypothetical protein